MDTQAPATSSDAVAADELPPPVPPLPAAYKPSIKSVIPPVPVPAAPREVKDPAWWRLGSIPFIVLILCAAGADLAWPDMDGGGIGAGIGCALWILAVLLLRRDLSKGESSFLIALALISFAGLTVSGSTFNWTLALVLPLILVTIPSSHPVEPAHYRTWWGYWVARRKSAKGGRWAWLRQILPTLITVFVGVALFILFLCIFASGNPVVLLVWETITEWWNKLVEYLQLDWDFVAHVAIWVLGVLAFGLYTFNRPAATLAAPDAPAVVKEGRSILPHLPLASLIGINLAFLVATGTDIAYLWFGRVPEGISQTSYLHDGAASITWAAALASAILVFLFRRNGSARQGVGTRVAGYLLVLQTFLLAVSVYMRLYHQIADYGFTVRRIQAAEAMLLGLDGLMILICYMACSGSFWKYTRICLGSMLLMFVGFGICPPAELAGNFNLRYAPSHPQWNFCATDFRKGCFEVDDNLAFALYVQEKWPDEFGYLRFRMESAAERVERRVQADSWTIWNLGLQRDIPAAEKILGRPLLPKEAEES